MMKDKQVQICWVTGNLTQRKQVIAKVKEALGEFDLETYTENDLIDFVIQQIRSVSCLGNKRLIAIKGWPEAPSRATVIKKMCKILQHLPSDCFILLDNLETKSKDFNDLLKKKGRVYHFSTKADVPTAINIVLERFSQEKKDINSDCAAILVNSICPQFGNERQVDVDRIMMLVKKLILYLGSRKVVKEEDALAVCSDEQNFIIWQLLQCLDSKDYCQSLLLVQKHLSNASSASNTLELMMNIMYVISWRYRMLIFIKEGMHKGWSENTIIEEIGKLPKLERVANSMGFYIKMQISKNAQGKTISQFTPNAVYVGMKIAPYYSRKELMLLIKAINEAIVKLRATQSYVESLLCLDSVILAASRVLSPKSTSFLRADYCY